MKHQSYTESDPTDFSEVDGGQINSDELETFNQGNLLQIYQ